MIWRRRWWPRTRPAPWRSAPKGADQNFLVLRKRLAHPIDSQFALVNVGSMPLPLQWGLAKGAGFFYVKRIAFSGVHDLTP